MPEKTLAELTVVDIHEGRAGSLYPLVHGAMPAVSAGQWLDYAMAAIRRGGILGLCGPDDLMFGFAVYEVRPTLTGGPLLHVGDFLVFELSRLGAGRRMLLAALEELAHLTGCAAMELPGECQGGPKPMS